MGQPAARLGDDHVCPKVEPGPVPHIGGPVGGPGIPSVIIEGRTAAVKGDGLICCGPPDKVAVGSGTVLIGGSPAARKGDSTVHGGVITDGADSVVIG